MGLRRPAMPGDRVVCPICCRKIGRAYVRRQKGSSTCLAYKVQGERTITMLIDLATNRRCNARASSHCGYDYGTYARPFHLELILPEVVVVDY